MTDLHTYLTNVLNTQGYDAWEALNDHLVDLATADDDAWVADLDSDLMGDWANAHGVDLTAVNPNTGCTYYQHWYWDNFDD